MMTQEGWTGLVLRLTNNPTNAKFSPRAAALFVVQLRMSLQKAEDMTAGEDSLQPSIGDDRQLVNVLTVHHRKRFER
jgi:hypothetical protein